MSAVRPADESESTSPRDVSRWRMGEVELDEATLELRVRGELVAIERKPLELLMWLLRHPGEVVTKEELFDALWAGRVVTESVLTKCVAKLRQALGEQGQAALRTVHGFGYRLVAPVQRLALSMQPPEPGPAALQCGDTPPLRPHWRLLQRFEGSRGENWLAGHEKSGEKRVFKFALDAAGLVQLKREITLHRLLRETLGPREDFVRLLDWNLDEAPYFVELDHCSQGSLGDWLDAQGGATAVPLATRLALVADVADALAAAHSAGVLHKDIKPGNVLIELDAAGAPRVRLADFGSGRLLDAERLRALAITQMGFTQTTSVDSSTAGTWAYLAPEVVAGQPATVRTDVFSLGVLLFQLVVGDLRRPLAPGWERDVGDAELRDDIGACCDVDPLRRLGDAAELARRLRSLPARQHEAAERRDAASRAAQLQQALLQARRRRRWLSVVAAVALAGLAVTATLYLQVRQARDAAQAAAARTAEEAAVSQAVLGFLNEDLLGAASPYDGIGRDVSVRSAVDAATRRAATRFADQPRVAAAVQLTLGKVYRDLGEPLAARAALLRALELYRGPARDDARLVGVLIDLSENHWDNDLAQQALPFAREAVEVARRLDPAQPLRLIEAEGELAWVLVRNDELEPASAALAAQYQAALALGPQAAAAADTLRFRLARVHSEAGRHAQSEPLMREHLAYRRALHGEDHLDTAFALRELGSILAWARQFDEAKALLQRALEVQLKHLPADDLEVLHTRNELATAHYQAREFELAEALWIETAEVGQRRHGESFGIAVSALGNAASANRQLGRHERALSFARRAVEAEARNPDAPPGDALITRFKFAEALLRVGRAAEALPLIDAIAREAEGRLPATSFWHGDFALRRGEALAALKRPVDAAASMRRALERYAAAEGIEASRVEEAQRLLAALPR